MWWASGYKLVFQTDALRQNVICKWRDSLWSGAVDVKRIRKAIELLYIWLHLMSNISDTCPGCKLTKAADQRPAGLLQLLPLPTREWGRVSKI